MYKVVGVIFARRDHTDKDCLCCSFVRSSKQAESSAYERLIQSQPNRTSRPPATMYIDTSVFMASTKKRPKTQKLKNTRYIMKKTTEGPTESIPPIIHHAAKRRSIHIMSILHYLYPVFTVRHTHTSNLFWRFQRPSPRNMATVAAAGDWGTPWGRACRPTTPPHFLVSPGRAAIIARTPIWSSPSTAFPFFSSPSPFSSTSSARCRSVEGKTETSFLCYVSRRCIWAAPTAAVATCLVTRHPYPPLRPTATSTSGFLGHLLPLLQRTR